jgi:hypothetical protein
MELRIETISSPYILSENFCLTAKLKPLERKILHRVISIASAVEWQNRIYELGSKLSEKRCMGVWYQIERSHSKTKAQRDFEF